MRAIPMASGYTVGWYKPYDASVSGYAWTVRDGRGVPQRRGMAPTAKAAQDAARAAHRELTTT